MTATFRRARACAGLLRVLADETRLRVVHELLAGPAFVHEMNARLGLEQSLLSHHLRVLREAGLVESSRIGKAVRYALNRRFRAGTEGIELGCCRLVFGG